MLKHNPNEFVMSLSAKLATRSRHVCAFFGAGISSACKLPDMNQLQKQILAALNVEDRKALKNQLENRNIEEALTRIRRIEALVTGDEQFDGLNKTKARELDAAICRAIVASLDIGRANLTPVNNFALWAGRADYRLPVEIFTVNYDLLLETALEYRQVPYFDGFIGTLQAKFHTDLVEGKPDSDREWMPSFFVRLWKLHGSVNWKWQEDRQIVRLGQPVRDGAAAAIYPSDAKYEESRRIPFVVLQDRLRRSLNEPETLVLIAGYSFNDKHLNELLFDAASRRARSEFLVFCHTEIPEELAKIASVTPNLQVVSGREAILSGLRAEWVVPTDPTPGLWVDDQFGLREFGNLATHLARGVARETEDLVNLNQATEIASIARKVGIGPNAHV